MPSRDPIVEEVRVVRVAIAKEFGYDVERIGRAMQERQTKSGRPKVRLRAKRIPVEKKAGWAPPPPVLDRRDDRRHRGHHMSDVSAEGEVRR